MIAELRRLKLVDSLALQVAALGNIERHTAQEGICATTPVARARDRRVAENFILRML